MSKTKYTKQQGALLLSAIVLILVFAFVGIMIARILIATHGTTKASQDSAEAFFLADSGMQSAGLRLFGLPLSQRLACSNITGDSDLTDVSVANRGVFTVTGTHRYTTSPTTLRLAITGTTSILPVVSTAAYADNGWVMIDREMINYKGKTETDNALCSPYSAPCFYGVTRGVGGTGADSHPGGTVVAQNMCQLVSSGGIPDLTTPLGKGVIHTNAPLPEAWLVGGNGGAGVIAKWNGETWENVTPGSPNVLNAISALSYNDVWAVGSGGTALHWDGNTWTSYSTGLGRPLRGVYCVKSNDCWAVGGNNSNGDIRHWDGSSWSTVSDPGNERLNSVSCSDANNCWAVGATNGNAAILYYNGTSWTNSISGNWTDVSNRRLNGISCTPSGNCFAVGDDKNSHLTVVACRYSGTPTCVRLTPPTVASISRDLDAIYCTGNNNCWAVGQRYSSDYFIVHYNGSTWSHWVDNSLPNRHLSGVNCANPDNCWAVGGSTGNYTSAAHWNGITWTNFALDPSIPLTVLRGVAVIAPQNPKLINWEEQ